jgi:hypothetical protein
VAAVVSTAASATKLTATQVSNVASVGNALAMADATGSLAPLTLALRLSPDAHAAAAMLTQLMPLDPAAQISRTASASLGFGAAMRNCATDVVEAKASDAGCSWGRYSFGMQPQAETPARLGLGEDNSSRGPLPGRHRTADSGTAAYGVEMPFGNGVSLSFASGYDTLGFGTADGSAGAGVSQGERAIFGSTLKKISGPWQASLNVVSAYGWYDNGRPTGFGTAFSEQDVSSALGGLRIAYQNDMGPWYVRPALDLDATFLKLGGYSESGAGAANLTVAPSGKWLFSAVPSIEAGASFADGGWTLKPYGRLGVSFSNSDQMGMLASFASAPSAGNFLVTSRLDGVMADLEAGVNLFATNGISARLNYEGHVGDVTENHIGGMKVQLPF